MMCAVELSLRVVAARVALCRQLASAAVPVTRAMLQPNQFELVVRLLNCALEHESDDDEHGIAYACLHLGNIYCRKLTQGVQQYAYTCVQDHSVWSNHRFWEAAFFHDVHELMRRHYGHQHDNNMPLSGKSHHDMWNLLEEPTAMALSAARLSNLSDFSNEELAKCSEEEESIVHGQAKHYVNLMIYLRVPLDASRLRRIDKNDLELRGNFRDQRDKSIYGKNFSVTDDVVVRSVPVMTLTKEKTISDQSLHSGGQLHGLPSKLASGLHDGLQMRSSCFQLLKVAFDEEVRCDEVEAFTKSLSSLRWPSVLPQSLFAYNTVSHLLTSTLPTGSKNKYSTIRELKKTIARFPGKNVPDIINPLNAADMHRHHLCDYERLRLRGIDSIFRISYANAHYDVVKT
ncbi:hypothetical protein GCK32_011005 [Trichostrongylus colubriformis]|uniref:SBF1/SBF2 domain-containing protein n=1 Tax=Trichostrongylus colubriformis TaxID=6319 RepID=A0AAN8G6V5_TRICO